MNRFSFLKINQSPTYKMNGVEETVENRKGKQVVKARKVKRHSTSNKYQN